MNTCADELRALIADRPIHVHAAVRDVGRASPGAFYAMLNGKRAVQPWMVETVVQALRLGDRERRRLHRMAAREAGWEIGE